MTKTFEEVSALVKDHSIYIERVLREIRKRIVGQNAMLEKMFIGLLTGGHILLEGVPGLAKTLAVKSLAEVIDVDFSRIQFTPDLLPADLIGTMVYNQKTSEFLPRKGPIFTNIILADEINRAPAKVQSALLEAMQERQVTIGDCTFKLSEPFLVLATQNPIEQEGTYPLPEAQLDRFLMKALVSYPNKAEEREIIERMTSTDGFAGDITSASPIRLDKILDSKQLDKLRSISSSIYIDERIKNYIIDIIFSTRNPAEHKLDLKHLIRFGASPRATLHMTIAAKAHAFISGRSYVVPDDIKAVGYDVLRHRILLTYEAEAENVISDDIIREILGKIEVP